VMENYKKRLMLDSSNKTCWEAAEDDGPGHPGEYEYDRGRVERKGISCDGKSGDSDNLDGPDN